MIHPTKARIDASRDFLQAVLDGIDGDRKNAGTLANCAVEMALLIGHLEGLLAATVAKAEGGVA